MIGHQPLERLAGILAAAIGVMYQRLGSALRQFAMMSASAAPRTKVKDQHFFTMEGWEGFFIAGIGKENAFTMLTTAPGPDVEPYHDRQISVMPPTFGMDWLLYEQPARLLKPLSAGTLRVKTLRQNGVSA